MSRFIVSLIAAVLLVPGVWTGAEAQGLRGVNHLYLERVLEAEAFSTSSNPNDRAISLIGKGAARYEAVRADSRGGTIRLWRSCEDTGPEGMREFLFSWTFDRDVAVVTRGMKVAVDARLERRHTTGCSRYRYHGYPTVKATNHGTGASVAVEQANVDGPTEIFYQDMGTVVDHGYLRLQPDFGVAVPSARFTVWTRESFWGPRDAKRPSRGWWGFTIEMGRGFHLNLSYLYRARFEAPRTTGTSSVCGTWNSDWGPVTFQCGATQADGSVPITGFWIQGPDKRGQITSGRHIPTTGELRFSYYQHWNNQTGSALLQNSADGRRLSGTWTQPSGSGSWALRR